MELGKLRDAANRLRALQQQASSMVEGQGDNWQRALVAIRRDIVAGIAQLSAATRTWSPPDGAAPEYATVIQNVNALRQALAMHQALWPAVSIDPRDPQFKTSVAQVRTAYSDLFAGLDALEREVAVVSRKGF